MLIVSGLSSLLDLALATTPPAPAPAGRSAGGGIDWTIIVTIAGTAAALVSATAVIVGGIYWYRTRAAREERASRELKLTSDVSDMGETLDELSRVVTSLVEEVRGRSPRPQLRFLANGEPTPSVVARIAAVPLVDVEAIVRAERTAALETRLPIGYGLAEPPKPAESTNEVTGISSTLATIQALRKAYLATGFGGSQERCLPVTQEHHDEFDARLDSYERDLRTFIGAWLNYLESRRLVIGLLTRITNDGGAPAEDARVKLHFPDPCHEAELPERPERPRRPRFSQKPNPLHPSNRFGNLAFPRVPTLPGYNPHVSPLHPNHGGPYYKSGSLDVSYWYRSLPHHEIVDLDPLVVGIPEPGIYGVRWTVGAKNLAHLEEGTLELEIRHDGRDEANPLLNLADLIKAASS